MTKVEKLKESVTKAEAKVEKCKGTIERHKKALDKKLAKVAKLGVTLENLAEKREEYRGTDESWELWEVERKLDDIQGAEKKLREAELTLENWKEKLAKESAKDAFVQQNAPQVIIDFLNAWKDMAYDWNVKRCDQTLEFKASLELAAEAIKEECAAKGIFRREAEKVLKEQNLDYRTLKSRVAQKAGSSIVLNMTTMYNVEERLLWLDKVLEDDKRHKLIDLISRVNAVVGKITDASHLEVNEKGNLDGYIVGTNGKAKVETIGAGGYNIVCFHYRTLVKPIK